MNVTDTRPELPRRRRALAAAMAAPTVILMIGVAAVEAWRVHRPQAALFASPYVSTLAEAVAMRELEWAYAFIRAGQDPDDPIPVRHPELTAGRTVLVSPLLWAVAMRNSEAVLMLIGHGARLDGPRGARAACLAERLGGADIAGLIRMHAPREASEPCPKDEESRAPLLEVGMVVE